MKQCCTLSLIDHLSATHTAQAQSEVLLNNQSTGIIVPGSVLEAAVEINSDRFLLFITDDILFEESLTIVLCQLEYGILEIVQIGLAYHSGYFKDLILYPDRLQFHFIGETAWTLRVREKPKLSLPFIGDPTGVQRQPDFRKWIVLTNKS